jgi:hypothetical protein
LEDKRLSIPILVATQWNLAATQFDSPFPVFLCIGAIRRWRSTKETFQMVLIESGN